MMHDLLMQLETIVIKLEQVNSLFNCMFRGYFEDANPNRNDLSANYTDIFGVINAIHDITDKRRETLNQTTSDLYVIRNELKRLGELI